MLTHLLYLHGFRSSPQSAKARRMALWAAAQPGLHWACPQLPPGPQAAMDLIDTITASWPAASTAVVGSSLGGYYATALAERRLLRGVLFNPAVEPARDLARQIGPQTCWHDPELAFEFTAEHVAQLQALRPPHSLRQRYLAVIAKGDEVLDWREMQARYREQQLLLLEGGDHGLTDFEPLLPAVEAFLLGENAAPCLPSLTTPGSSSPAA
jgi:predicted esterase YcpF (UPF0227 family)